MRSGPALVIAAGVACIPAPAQALAAHARALGCPPLARAASLPVRAGGGPLTADMDGDGSEDAVTIRFARGARVSCGFVLVVRTRSGIRALPIPESYKGTSILVRDWPFAEPFLAVVVRLAADRDQIVVAREHGAAVANVNLYA